MQRFCLEWAWSVILRGVRGVQRMCLLLLYASGWIDRWRAGYISEGSSQSLSVCATRTPSLQISCSVQSGSAPPWHRLALTHLSFPMVTVSRHTRADVDRGTPVSALFGIRGLLAGWRTGRSRERTCGSLCHRLSPFVCCRWWRFYAQHMLGIFFSLYPEESVPSSAAAGGGGGGVRASPRCLKCFARLCVSASTSRTVLSNRGLGSQCFSMKSGASTLAPFAKAGASSQVGGAGGFSSSQPMPSPPADGQPALSATYPTHVVGLDQGGTTLVNQSLRDSRTQPSPFPAPPSSLSTVPASSSARVLQSSTPGPSGAQPPDPSGQLSQHQDPFQPSLPHPPPSSSALHSTAPYQNAAASDGDAYLRRAVFIFDYLYACVCLRLQREIDQRGGWYRGGGEPEQDRQEAGLRSSTADMTSTAQGGGLDNPTAGTLGALYGGEGNAIDDERRPLLAASSFSSPRKTGTEGGGGGADKSAVGGGEDKSRAMGPGRSIHFGKRGAAVFVFSESLAACRDAVEELLTTNGAVKKYTDLQKLYQDL